MPGHYAHYRFASEQLHRMDRETQNTVNRFRQLYDVGAQGPDPFFYFNPFVKNEIYKLSHQIHWEPGRVFFEQACRMNTTEAGAAYLYGCLTHFALDRACHPYVHEVDNSGAGKHVAMETEFDRFLMDLDGKVSPHTTDPSAYLTLTRGECETAASFYRGVSRAEFSRCLGNMKLFNKLFNAPEGLPRDVVKKVTEMVGYGGFIMTKGPDEQHKQFDEPMLELYEQAQQRFPAMLAQLRDHLQTGAPLGEEFDTIYG